MLLQIIENSEELLIFTISEVKTKKVSKYLLVHFKITIIK